MDHQVTSASSASLAAAIEQSAAARPPIRVRAGSASRQGDWVSSPIADPGGGEEYDSYTLPGGGRAAHTFFGRFRVIPGTTDGEVIIASTADTVLRHPEHRHHVYGAGDCRRWVRQRSADPITLIVRPVVD